MEDGDISDQTVDIEIASMSSTDSDMKIIMSPLIPEWLSIEQISTNMSSRVTNLITEINIYANQNYPNNNNDTTNSIDTSAGIRFRLWVLMMATFMVVLNRLKHITLYCLIWIYLKVSVVMKPILAMLNEKLKQYVDQQSNNEEKQPAVLMNLSIIPDVVVSNNMDEMREKHRDSDNS